MPTGSSTWPTTPDGLSTVNPLDGDTLFGGAKTAGQYIRDLGATVNAVQGDLGASTNTPNGSLRGRIAILEQAGRSNVGGGVGSLICTLAASGSIAASTQSQVIVQRTDGAGSVLRTLYPLVVQVADVANPYGNAANGTISAGTDPTSGLTPTVLKVVTAGKQIVFRSDANGIITVAATSTVSGDNITLLFGPAFGAPALDYSNSFSLTVQA